MTTIILQCKMKATLNRKRKRGGHTMKSVIQQQFSVAALFHVYGPTAASMPWKLLTITEVPAMKRPHNGMRAIHPGEILREEFLLPLSLSVNALAKALMCPQRGCTPSSTVSAASRRTRQRGWHGISAGMPLPGLRCRRPTISRHCQHAARSNAACSLGRHESWTRGPGSAPRIRAHDPVNARSVLRSPACRPAPGAAARA